MQSLDVGSITLIAGTGLAAGLVNAIAGGGSLISFPVLVAAGLPAVTANITNTIALCPGYFGGAFAQRRDLVGQRSRVMMLLPTSLIGGVVGALLLLWTGEEAFDTVPVAFRGGAARVSKPTAGFHDGAQTWRPQRNLVDCAGGNRCDLRWLLRRGAGRDSARGACGGHRRLAHPTQCAQATDLARGQRQCRSRVFVFGANRLGNHTGNGNRCAGWRCDRRRDRLSRSRKTAPLDRDCGRPRNFGRLLRAVV